MVPSSWAHDQARLWEDKVKSVTSGLGGWLDEMQIDRQPGEACIRHSAPRRYPFAPMLDTSMLDTWSEGWTERGLVLTHRRLLWVRRGPTSGPLRGKVLKEIPLDRVKGSTATRAVRPWWLVWGALGPLLILLTRRLEIAYEADGRERKLRIHISDARGWAEDILRAARLQA